MLKTLLAATAAIALTAGVGFAQSGYSSSTSQTTTGAAPSDHVHVSKTVRTSGDQNGMVTEKRKTVSKDVGNDNDHDRMIAHDADHDHDFGVVHKDKTVTKDRSVSSNGDVSRNRTETTTVH